MKFFTAYGARCRCVVPQMVNDDDVSRTHSEFKDDCDINVILKRFGVTGLVPQNVKVPLEGDFQNAPDFQGAMNCIIDAKKSFMALQPLVRARFGNDPHAFVRFCTDPKNLDEMRSMGLAVPKPVPAATTAAS